MRLVELRDQILGLGLGSVSTADLLAVVMATGHIPEAFDVAPDLLSEGLFGLARIPVSELMEKENLGLAKACQVGAIFELARRMSHEVVAQKPRINRPSDAVGMVMDIVSQKEQEHFGVIMMDTRNGVIGVHIVYIGGIATALIRVAEVFKEPIRRSASGIILFHNHPSGDPSPSPEDVAVTRTIIESGKQLGIEVRDHVVLGHNNFVSLLERGLAFSSYSNVVVGSPL